MGTLVKKTQIVPFLGDTEATPNWTRIKKSTTLTIAMNPQTKTFDFISSDTPVEEVDSYQPSIAQSLTMYKGEADYQMVFDMLYKRVTGGDAHRPFLLAFYQEIASEGSGETAKTVYKAWKVDSLVKINQMDTVAETIDFDLGLSDITEGAVELTAGKPVFTAGTFTTTGDTTVFTPAA